MYSHELLNYNYYVAEELCLRNVIQGCKCIVLQLFQNIEIVIEIKHDETDIAYWNHNTNRQPQ